jgi:hypothetical protein
MPPAGRTKSLTVQTQPKGMETEDPVTYLPTKTIANTSKSTLLKSHSTAWISSESEPLSEHCVYNNSIKYSKIGKYIQIPQLHHLSSEFVDW